MADEIRDADARLAELGRAAVILRIEPDVEESHGASVKTFGIYVNAR
ncbi:MAG: hypothetical protein HYU41_09100 [Candidatus Rokubacteria bacterium]|nr:hypothetical protein [Candidatus Rokubacteria bacterium]